MSLLVCFSLCALQVCLSGCCGLFVVLHSQQHAPVWSACVNSLLSYSRAPLPSAFPSSAGMRCTLCLLFVPWQLSLWLLLANPTVCELLLLALL